MATSVERPTMNGNGGDPANYLRELTSIEQSTMIVGVKSEADVRRFAIANRDRGPERHRNFGLRSPATITAGRLASAAGPMPAARHVV